MAEISSANNATTADVTTTAAKGANDIGDLTTDEFLQLMIAEMQNQDPLEPMTNSEMMSQVGQLREIASNESLSDTLESVMLGQNFSTASAMIGQYVDALSDEGRNVQGKVARVSVSVEDENDPLSPKEIRLFVGGSEVQLTNVRTVMPKEQFELIFEDSTGLDVDDVEEATGS